MFYVRIDGISDKDLEFFGYFLVAESSRFKLYRDYRGEDHLVVKSRPYLLIEDMNEAQDIAALSGAQEAVNMPPRSH